MSRSLNKLLDPTGWRILSELQRNGRISLSELARRVNLSAPAAQERVRRLEEAGVIDGYHAEVDASKLGFPILAFVRINTPTRAYSRFLAVVEGMPEIIECHHVAGVDSFVLKVCASTNAHLEEVLRRLSPFGETTTSIVLSSPVSRRTLEMRRAAEGRTPAKVFAQGVGYNVSRCRNSSSCSISSLRRAQPHS